MHCRGRLHGDIGLAVNENGTVPELDRIPCNVGRAARPDKRDLLSCELAGPRGRRRRPCVQWAVAAARALASGKGSRRTAVPDGLIVGEPIRPFARGELIGMRVVLPVDHDVVAIGSVYRDGAGRARGGTPRENLCGDMVGEQLVIRQTACRSG